MKKLKLYKSLCKFIFALIVLMFTTGVLGTIGGYIYLWICYPEVALLITFVFVLYVTIEIYIKE